MGTDVTAVFTFLSDSFVSLFNSFLNDWGFIGLSIVGIWLLSRVVKLFKKIVQF